MTSSGSESDGAAPAREGVFGRSIDALFSGFGGRASADAEAEGPPRRKRMVRVVADSVRRIDPATTDPAEMLHVPAWMRAEPKWVQRLTLENAGVVPSRREAAAAEAEERERRRPLREQQPPAEALQLAGENWESMGRLPHTRQHIIFSSDSEGDEPDTAAAAASRKRSREGDEFDPETRRRRLLAARAELQQQQRAKRRGVLDVDGILGPAAPPAAAAPAPAAAAAAETVSANVPYYSFCLNRNCPQYRRADLREWQRWQGECCGLRDQPDPSALPPEADGSGSDEADGGLGDGSGGGDDDESDLVPGELEQSVAAASSFLQEATGASCAASESAEAPAEEDEEEDEAEEAFVEKCLGLLRAVDAQDPADVVYLLSHRADLEELLEDYGAGRITFAAFQQAALRVVAAVSSHHRTHNPRPGPPPKRPVFIAGQRMDF
eukprot:TRINITY_DN9849_c2_g1_i1.p1 TRINITY_DN9849_c2_g1~~TRINITY_DN9849_c2_g1_i1.p1  ORF type:complete len:468 (+),score=169.65 TRINITY_DN9849_c2_g1_i1:93-1406(+)